MCSCTVNVVTGGRHFGSSDRLHHLRVVKMLALIIAWTFLYTYMYRLKKRKTQSKLRMVGDYHWTFQERDQQMSQKRKQFRTLKTPCHKRVVENDP